jgi:periplasmic divalent cation tolerance protein
MSYAVTMTTCGKRAEAERIAAGVIARKLAGCVQIVKVRSFYEWQGQLQRDKEFLLLAKGPRDKFAELKQFILDQHAYELPEIICVDITAGHDPYLDWLSANSIAGADAPTDLTG